MLCSVNLWSRCYTDVHAYESQPWLATTTNPYPQPGSTVLVLFAEHIACSSNIFCSEQISFCKIRIASQINPLSRSQAAKLNFNKLFDPIFRLPVYVTFRDVIYAVGSSELKKRWICRYEYRFCCYYTFTIFTGSITMLHTYTQLYTHPGNSSRHSTQSRTSVSADSRSLALLETVAVRAETELSGCRTCWSNVGQHCT